jgi:curved DNA-binding protein CbpA
LYYIVESHCAQRPASFGGVPGQCPVDRSFCNRCLKYLACRDLDLFGAVMVKEEQKVQQRRNLLSHQTKTRDSISCSSHSSRIGIAPPSFSSVSTRDSRSDSRSSFRRKLLHDQMNKQTTTCVSDSKKSQEPQQLPKQQQQLAEEREQGSSRLGGGASRRSLIAMRGRRLKANSLAALSTSPPPPKASSFGEVEEGPEIDRLESMGRASAVHNVKTRMQSRRLSFSESSSPSSPAPPSPSEEREAGNASPPTPWTLFPACPSTPAASALPGDELPTGHVKTISDIFGSEGSLDLYRDVLMVSPDASDREIRIAYFRRGREVLSEAGFQPVSTSDPVTTGGILDPQTRIKFEALSMAYEILSTPAWKETYLKHGLRAIPLTVQQPQPELKVSPVVEKVLPSEESAKVSTGTTPSPGVATSNDDGSAEVSGGSQSNPHSQEDQSAPSGPISAVRLASSLRSGRRSINFSGYLDGDDSFGELPQLKLGVRWKEHVEEMVFENHPNEHAPSFDDEEDDDIFDDEDYYSDRDHRGRQMRTNKSSGSDNSALESSSGDVKDTHSSPSIGSVSTKKRKKVKPKVVIESDELESHLLRMDNEAEKHFVFDFFDNFEESLDGILSLVDSFGDPLSSSRRSSRSTLSKNRHARSSKALSAPEKAQSTWSIGRSRSHDSGDIDRKKGPSSDDSAEIKRASSFPSPCTEPTAASVAARNIGTSSQGSDDTAKMKTVDNKNATSCSALTTTTEGGISFSLTPSPAAAITPAEVSPGSSCSGLSSPLRATSSKHAMIDTFEKESPIAPRPEDDKLLTPDIASPDAKISTNQTTVSRSKNAVQRMHDLSSSYSEAEDTLPPPLFRPISPEYSQGAEPFDLESLNLSEMENPFREEQQPLIKPQERPLDDVPESPFPAVSRSMSSGNIKRGNTSLVTSARTSVKTPNVPTIPMASSARRSVKSPSLHSKGKASKSEESEDVFAGLDDAQKFAMVEAGVVPVTLRGRNISLQRMNSTYTSASSDCFSDLSESIATSGRSVTRTEGKISRATYQTSAKKVQGATNWRPLSRSASQDPHLAMDLLSPTSCDASVNSVESAVKDASGFYDYFIAYVTAIITECAMTGNQTHDVHQDFVSFCNVGSFGSTDKREKAASGTASSFNGCI